MRKVTLIRGARQLLTLRGPGGPRRGADLRNLGIIQDGSVLIADGLIVEVGPTRRLENLAIARGAEEIDASGCVVLPGFADSHMLLVRATPGVARPIHELPPSALRTPALRVLDEAVRWGTTAIEAKSGLGLTEAAELKILRLHSEMKELPLTFVSTFLAGFPEAGSGERILPMLRRRRIAEYAETRCEQGAFTPAQACHFLTAAHQFRLGLKLSAGRPAYPDAIGVAVERGASVVDDVAEAGERDVCMLAQSQTMATISPAVAFNVQADRSDVARTLIDNGVAVALASGWHAEFAPSPNMHMTIALACRLMNMTVAEAIAAATINGAHAMGRATSIGSLETGKSADLAILAVPDYRELPYHLGVNLVNLVMIRGAVLAQRAEVKWPVR